VTAPRETAGAGTTQTLVEAAEARGRAHAYEHAAQHCDIIADHMSPRFCASRIRDLARKAAQQTSGPTEAATPTRSRGLGVEPSRSRLVGTPGHCAGTPTRPAGRSVAVDDEEPSHAEAE
jgi:hypothetical protein